MSVEERATLGTFGAAFGPLASNQEEKGSGRDFFLFCFFSTPKSGKINCSLLYFQLLTEPGLGGEASSPDSSGGNRVPPGESERRERLKGVVPLGQKTTI